MARKKGGQRVDGDGPEGSTEAVRQSLSLKVAGEPKFRLGPVGSEPPAEAFDWDVAPESPGILERLLSKLTEEAETTASQLSLAQEELEAELGEAKASAQED